MYKIVSGVKVLEELLDTGTNYIGLWFWESDGEYCETPLLFDSLFEAEKIAEYLNAEIEEV
jgi:hypothetical protein